MTLAGDYNSVRGGKNSMKIKILCTIVFFSDEAFFFLRGTVKCRYWSDENPRIVQKRHTQAPEKIALVHFNGIVRNFLNCMFLNKWIDMRDETEWQPISPDLTPLDFSFLNFLKKHVILLNLKVGSITAS